MSQGAPANYTEVLFSKPAISYLELMKAIIKQKVFCSEYEMRRVMKLSEKAGLKMCEWQVDR